MNYREIIINGQHIKLIPLGDCACGCGGKTTIAKRTKGKAIKGQFNKFCHGHGAHAMNNKHGPNWRGGRTNRGIYPIVFAPGHPRADDKGYVPEHIIQSEKALGKYLPKGVEIHHFTPDQLVICQDQGFHKMLHRRQRAYEDCGHASWRKCWICREYSDPDGMVKRGTIYVHRECNNKYLREYKKVKRRSIEDLASGLGIKTLLT